MPASDSAQEYYGLHILTSRHPAIRRLKQQHPTQLHGNKTWGAALGLIDHLRENPPPLNSAIVDMGCGWGLPGLFCAKNYGASVTAVDADANVFPYLDLHADINGVEVSTLAMSFEDVQIEQLQGFDWLIAADICFWDELVEPVFGLVEKACEAGVGKIVIADPQRPPFIEMAERCVDAFYGEIEQRLPDQPRKTHTALLIIENA